MSYKGNKGEWSETYAFLKILADGVMPTSPQNNETAEKESVPIEKVVLVSSGKKPIRAIYDISTKRGTVLVFSEDGRLLGEVSRQQISAVLPVLLKCIESGKGSIKVPKANRLLRNLRIKQIAANKKQKEDFSVIIYNGITKTHVEMGLSVKSLIGGKPTTINASGATSFAYEVKNMTKDQRKRIGAIRGKNKLRRRLEEMERMGIELVYSDMTSDIGHKNLRKVDSLMPEIMAYSVMSYYTGKGAALSDLALHLGNNRKLCRKLDMSYDDYVYKKKKLLEAAVGGMTPASAWDGKTDTVDGYLVVGKNGELCCYPMSNRDALMDYLFLNARIDTPSIKRHKFGKFYTRGGKTYVNLNFQVRHGS